MHETIDAHPTVNDSTGIQETPRKSRFLKRNWKKAALALIGLDLLVAVIITVFGGGDLVQSLVFGVFR